MKKAKKIIIYFFITLFAIPMVLLIISEVTGIGNKENGFKVYKAYSPIKEGEELIKKYNIKCVAKDVETTFFIDISRGETFFAYNIDHNNYYVYENIKFDKVPDATAKQYQLTAHISWLDTYGKWMFYSVGAICLILVLYKWWSERPKKSKPFKSKYASR